LKILEFIGNRVIKTGVSVFLTAWICTLLNWPPVFAVITAIVTIEPTVSDSIKKGIIRFPASAIGSAYAVLFIYLFGNTPLTYTLAAVLTILTCFRLNLHAGLLVATLTSVAMVEVIHSNFLVSFFIRLGTTTVGLLVSTVVNMFILPPDYRENIIKNLVSIRRQTGKITEKLMRSVLEDKQDSNLDDILSKARKKIILTENLIQFQKEEARYHPLIKSEKSHFEQLKKQLDALRTIHYHVSNILNTPVKTLSWTKDDRNIVIAAVKDLHESLDQSNNFKLENHKHQMKQITEIFWEDNEEITKNNEIHPTKFPPELIILYELVSIYDQVEDFYQLEEKMPTIK